MRYTTIIDISQADIYRNVNARLLYLHLCLKAGYHDDDRDLIVISVRNLASQVGLTVSATRFAIHQLERAGLLAHNGSIWRVRKWVDEKSITPRKKEATEAKKQATEEARRMQAEKNDQESARRDAIRNSDKTPFEQYYEAQLKKAAAGDAQAAAVVEKRKSTYESIKNRKK